MWCARRAFWPSTEGAPLRSCGACYTAVSAGVWVGRGGLAVGGRFIHLGLVCVARVCAYFLLRQLLTVGVHACWKVIWVPLSWLHIVRSDGIITQTWTRAPMSSPPRRHANRPVRPGQAGAGRRGAGVGRGAQDRGRHAQRLVRRGRVQPDRPGQDPHADGRQAQGRAAHRAGRRGDGRLARLLARDDAVYGM